MASRPAPAKKAPAKETAAKPPAPAARQAKPAAAAPKAKAVAAPVFVVIESDAAAIRTAYEQEGELSAAIELRRLFPGITDNVQARACARTTAGWQPLPPLPPKKPRACRTRSSTR